MALAHNVQWLTSNKGTPLLVIDDYIFKDMGKGKLVSAPAVRYWACKHGCGVKAKTDGQNLLHVEGLRHAEDHGHVNDSSELKDRSFKVSDVGLLLFIFVVTLTRDISSLCPTVDNLKVCRAMNPVNPQMNRAETVRTKQTRCSKSRSVRRQCAIKSLSLTLL